MTSAIAARALLVSVAVLGLAGCIDDGADIDANVAVPVPQALACALAEDALSARLWISGNASPCELAVAGGATTGSCPASAGRVRTLTLDWLTQEQGLDVVLAQARGTVDLTKGDQATVKFAVDANNIESSNCFDMTADQVEGSPTTLVRNVAVPVCDLDDSCKNAGGAPCTNLDEVCAGTDPLNPAQEPP